MCREQMQEKMHLWPIESPQQLVVSPVVSAETCAPKVSAEYQAHLWR